MTLSSALRRSMALARPAAARAAQRRTTSGTSGAMKCASWRTAKPASRSLGAAARRACSACGGEAIASISSNRNGCAGTRTPPGSSTRARAPSVPRSSSMCSRTSNRLSRDWPAPQRKAPRAAPPRAGGRARGSPSTRRARATFIPLSARNASSPPLPSRCRTATAPQVWRGAARRAPPRAESRTRSAALDLGQRREVVRVVAGRSHAARAQVEDPVLRGAGLARRRRPAPSSPATSGARQRGHLEGPLRERPRHRRLRRGPRHEQHQGRDERHDTERQARDQAWAARSAAPPRAGPPRPPPRGACRSRAARAPARRPLAPARLVRTTR